jgi:hypothetical protein
MINVAGVLPVAMPSLSNFSSQVADVTSYSEMRSFRRLCHC